MHLITISIAAAVSVLFFTGLQVQAAPNCEPAKCVHPKCVCPSTKPPLGMSPKTVPQFFTLTFDGAINGSTVPVAASLMANRRNPNGCPIPATWFAQTLHSDFALIQQWYAAGNEVADLTMTHVGTPPAEEVVGNRKAINAFSGIPYSNMTGFRAPLLSYSKATFDILAEEKIEYDSSTTAALNDRYWPYTLDYGLANDCENGICSEGVALPGMWEISIHATMEGEGKSAIPHGMDPHLDNPSMETVRTWLDNTFIGHKPRRVVRDQPAVVAVDKEPVPTSQLANQDYMKCDRPVVGKEICNGLDDTNTGKIDSDILETCNFADESWSTCYGCPKKIPTPSDPVPERVIAPGQRGARSPVPATCAMEWWDPVDAQCLCTSSNCPSTGPATS